MTQQAPPFELIEFDVSPPKSSVWQQKLEELSVVTLVPGVGSLHQQMETLSAENPNAQLDDYLAVCEGVVEQEDNVDVLPKDIVTALERFAPDALSRAAMAEFVNNFDRKYSLEQEGDIAAVLQIRQKLVEDIHDEFDIHRQFKQLLRQPNAANEEHADIVAKNLFKDHPPKMSPKKPCGRLEENEIQLEEVDYVPSTESSKPARKGWLHRMGAAVRSKRLHTNDAKAQRTLSVAQDIKSGEPRLFAKKAISPEKSRPKRRLKQALACGAVALLAVGIGMKLKSDTDSAAPKEAANTELITPTTTEASTTTTTISIDNETYTTIASALAEIERIHNIQPDDPGYDDVVEKTFFLASLQNN